MMRWIIIICSFSLSWYLLVSSLPKAVNIPLMHKRIELTNLDEYEDYFLFTSFALGLYALICMSPPQDEKCVCKINGFEWNLNDFCRGWLITGKTGSGKTASAISHIIHQLFQRVKKGNGFKPWGGVAVDQKGNFFKIIEDIAANYGQSKRLITLKVRPEGAPSNWKPKYKYNLLSYPGIPASTYAKIIIDTAASLGQDSGGGSSSFFKTQAQIHIERAIELLQLLKFIKNGGGDSLRLDFLLGTEVEDGETISDLEFYKTVMPSYVSLKNVFNLLTDSEVIKKTTGLLKIVLDHNILASENNELKKTEELFKHFNGSFINQPPEQLGGVTGTIHNYLGFFTSDDICEVFCAEKNTVNFEKVDQGKIISISMPQRYQTERAYVNTFMKLIYYTHVLKRLDDPEKLGKNNLLLLIADEAQGVVTASKDGMTDYETVDKIREARATVLFASQSTTSFLPVMKKEEVNTLLLNLANQVHYTVADEDNAVQIANVIGKAEKIKKSRGFSGGKASFNYQPVDEHIIKPYVLRAMKKFECVLIHCERGYKKFTLPPIGPDGEIPAYFKKIKR